MSGDRFGPNPTAVMPADATAAPHARMSSPPQMTAGATTNPPPETPTLWQKIQGLPIIGRAASDEFRENIAQAWQGIKERFAGYRNPTAIPYVGLAMGAANAAVPETEALKLSQESKAALDALGDVAAGVTQKLPKFAILSADREGLLPQVLKERHAALGDALKEGYEPIEHKGGVWVNDAGKRVKERGYIVPGMDAPQARHMGARFGQQAVITNEGYHDVNTGMTAPFKDAGAPVGKEPYTVLPGGKKLALRFDFENMKPTGTPEPTGLRGAVQEGGTRLPAGAPSVLGYPQRHGLPLAREDAVGLGIAGRHLLQDFPKKADWIERMKTLHPSYAPHLEGQAGDQAWSAATRAKTPVMPSSAEIQSLAHSATGESTRPWYHTWAPAVEQAFGKDDGEMLTRFHAILSAQASPARNAELSLQALEDYKAGDLSFKSVGTTPERAAALKQQAEAGPAGIARMAQEGPKVNNFYLALKGHPEAVVLDRHMGRAYLGKPQISDAEYPAVEARVRQDAAEAGQSPRDFQAMVWGGQTKYPFQAPEEHLWNWMTQDTHYRFPKGMDARIPQLKATLNDYNAQRATLAHPEAPTHAAVRVGTEVFEVPMNRGHAGALEKAIEEMRGLPGYEGADGVMADAEDGYTRGDGKFIPRAAVENLHSSDFIHAKRANPRNTDTGRE